MPAFLAHARAMPAGVALRAATGDDYAFQRDLYASVREEEMRLATAWTDAQKRAFLADQFALQDAHYHRHYPDAEWIVIERDRVPVGRLVISVNAAEVRLMDVALLQAQRGHGIGTALLQEIVAFADSRSLPVTLHVEPFNPAMRMYVRAGFVPVEMRGIYQFMRRDQLKTAS